MDKVKFRDSLLFVGVERMLALGIVVDDDAELVLSRHDDKVVGLSSLFAPPDGIRGVDPRRGDGTVN